MSLRSYCFNFVRCIPMEVYLVNPPVLGVLEPWYDTPSFGRTALAYLAGYLRQYPGFDNTIIDAKFERLNFNQVLERILQLNPNLVGFTAFTNEIKPAAYQAFKVKQVLPETVTVIGGVHVTSLPSQTLEEFPSFDIGVVGEGEISFYELCSALREGNPLGNIPGLVYRMNGEIRQTSQRERILDQDSIPFPAWDLMPKAETYFIQSIRGCPFNCLFCMNPNGKVARKRSVGRVIQEIELIIRSYHPERISFGDELFNVDMKRTHELLDAMIENKIGERVQWDVQTHVDFVDDALFAKFKKANLTRVELGVETGEEKSLKKMGKGTDLEAIKRACDSARNARVKIGTFLLFGQPNETVDSLKKTINLAAKINPELPMFGLMTPYPGTEVARMDANGEGGYRLLTTDWDEYNKQIGGAMEFANLTRRQIEWMQILGYLRVYTHNHRYIDLIKFLWEYRKGAFEVIRKIITGKDKLIELVRKLADYDHVLKRDSPVSINTLITAREKWQIVQQTELKRAKEIKADLML